MNFTIFSPNDSPVKNNEFDLVDFDFGGQRQHSKTASTKDYTTRKGASPNIQKNPTDTTIKDIDNMANDKIRKNEFTMQENLMDTQRNNEFNIVKSDSDNIPLMDEGSDATRKPNSVKPKRNRKPNQWNFSTDSMYDGEIR